jgi:LEA14-like dessication related protein
MMFKKLILNSFVLFLILSLSACAGLEKKTEVFKVNISNLQILDSTLMEQRYQVTLRLINRSRTAYAIEGMSFDIELNGKDFASGVSNKQLQLEPFSETLVTVDVSSTIFGIIRQINNLQQNKPDAFEYQISGSVYTGQSFFSIPFEQSGQIDLKPAAR